MNQGKLEHFRTTVLNDITDNITSDNTGGIREEKFTEIAIEYLEDAIETEGAVLCREIRENSVGNRIHKINGYAISEGYETVDLFITIFKGYDNLGRLYTDDLKSAVNLSTRFLYNLLTGRMEGIEETAPVFDFAKTIQKIAKDIVRVNIYILSDMLIPVDPPKPAEVGGIKVHYHVRDIEYFYRIYTSGAGKEVITINFLDSFKEQVPCLSMQKKNEDYDSYLCIIPANILADIYEDYGARLLEQNVRTFLQFRGNINKGIRDTILKEPHMFMAYNNGISATAESVVLSDDLKKIVSVKDFQIVNGGQTTASIFQTRRKFKTIDISSICVQVKLTVINDPSKKTEIVSRISRYANTQNKVSEADLSSNHPLHIELEQISRKIWTQAVVGKNQTRWFYERARGQYNDEIYQIDKKAQQTKWLDRNPKNQKFAKEDLARFYMSWEMEPWWVVRGRQKCFIEFMKIADDLDVTTDFFEDLIAKAIIFRKAEQLYGTGAKAIGDLRYMVVPYTLSLLRKLTDDRFNLSMIWKQQGISSEFEKILFTTLHKVNQFMRDTAPGGLIGEWAKKEECWKRLKEYINLDISTIESELYNDLDPNSKKIDSTIDSIQIDLIKKKIKKINIDGLINIDEWGKATGILTIFESNTIWKIIRKIENNKEITNKELITASNIFKTIEDEQSKALLP